MGLIETISDQVRQKIEVRILAEIFRHEYKPVYFSGTANPSRHLTDIELKTMYGGKIVTMSDLKRSREEVAE